MKVSRGSWHYKVACHMSSHMSEHRPSDSLCIYFWQVVGGSLFALFASLAVLFVSYVALFPFLSTAATLLGSSTWFLLTERTFDLFVTGIIVDFIVLSLFSIFAYQETNFYERYGRKGLTVNLPEGSFTQLAFEKAKAGKRKVCPKLDFVD